MDVQEASQREKFTSLGRYQVRQRIGRGDIGEVWLCEDTRQHRQVAIKTLPMQRLQHKNFARHFEHEAKIVSKLHHPHILTIHAYGKHILSDDMFIAYMVMPFLRAGSLAAEIASAETLLPAQRAFTILHQVASAIDFAHQRRIIHRDIKPTNILLDNEHNALLADFGIARMLVDTSYLTQASQLTRTPDYLAPEQAEGRAESTSDIYSLAIIAYQLFTGRVPFTGTTALATIMKHVMDAPPSPRDLNPHLSLAFEQVILQGLTKNPMQRPALAAAFITQLQAAWQDSSYQPEKLKTIEELPELGFQESEATTSNTLLDIQRLKLTRRTLLFTGATATMAIIGAGSGAWALWQNIQDNFITLPQQSLPSARPTTQGPNEPVLILTGHNLYTTSLVWSIDGSKLYSTGADGNVCLWNITELSTTPVKEPLYTKRQHISMFGSQLFCTLSNDGTQLGFANADQNSPVFDQPHVRFASTDLTNITAATNMLTMPEGMAITGLSWLQQKYLIVGQSAYISDALSQQQYRLFVVDTSQSHPQLRATPDARAGELLALIPQPRSNGSIIALVEDQAIAIAQISMAQQQPQWHILHAVKIPSQHSSDGNINYWAVTWSGDGRYLIAPIDNPNNATDQQLAYWKWQEQQPQFQRLNMPPHSQDILCIAADPSSSQIAIGTSTGEIYLWDLQKGPDYQRQLKTNIADTSVMTIAWSKDGKQLAAGLNDVQASICIWRIEA
jgi:serine/threonine protein kinase